MDNHRLPNTTEIVVVIWGEAFWSLFVQYGLPTHLSEKNIAALKQLNARCKFYCKPQEFEKFKHSASMAKLNSLFPLDVIDLARFEDESDSFQYPLMTRCHQHAICDAGDAALIFLAPDTVSSDNGYEGVLEIAKQGYRAVMIQGLRLVKERFVEFVEAGFVDLEHLTARNLGKLSTQILHPLTKAHFVRANANRSYGTYLWMNPGSGILAHCFHLHPLFYWPEKPGARIGTTIDHELVRIGVGDPDKVYVVQDSDIVFQCELSKLDHLIDYIEMKPIALIDVGSWAKDWTNGYHRNYFQLPIHFRFGDGDILEENTRKSGLFVKNVLTMLERESGHLISDDMLVARSLYESQGNYISGPL